MKIDYQDDWLVMITITWDDGTFDKHVDSSNSHWDWIKPALERAYKEGHKAGEASVWERYIVLDN